MTTKRTETLLISITPENHEFVSAFGKARHSDGVRYNFSEEINNYLEKLRAGHSPEATAVSLKKERDGYEKGIKDVDQRAVKHLGMTLDQFIDAHETSIREHQKSLRQASKKASEKIKQDKLQFIEKAKTDYQKYKGDGESTERSDLSWVKSRYKKEIRKHSIEPEVLVRELRGENHKGADMFA